MHDMTARTTAALQWAPVGRFPIATETLRLDELPLSGILRIQARSNDGEFPIRLAEATGIALPIPGRFHVDVLNRACLAWSGPGEWIYFCSIADEANRFSRIENICEGSIARITLISDSRIAFSVSGIDAPDLLEKGCSLNLSPLSFPTGCVATTRFAGVPSMVLHRRPGEYLLYFDVSYCAYLMNWWIDAASEFLPTGI